MLGVQDTGEGNESTEAELMTVPAIILQSFNIDVFYKKLTRWIVTGNQPFTEIENEELRDMIIYLHPALSDHLIRSAALKERLFGHAEIMRRSTKQYLRDLPGLLAIACDGWTSSNRIAFLAITGSWVTLDWERQETLLDFVELQGAHSGENMADLVGKTLTDLGIVDQVVSLVSDSASNNGTLVRHLSNQLRRSSPNSRWDGTKGHIRCLAHVIHLAVMSFLRALHAVPESVDIRDFDYNNKEFTQETAEATVAENHQESLESDDTDTVDPLVNLHSGISKVCT
ncbi:transposase, putative [Rhizoctonia solani AG-3 Rhs1AP]|uniref:Transposase, putative n=2 Tax=Rhizoctonia solani AG-3 TaxID=1086053 RepID=X8JJD3_9AGAM|nr:transposase, putative [Rhizoctonia solani AG-3 Rhs1AP]KEP46256.1 putative transposase [Rhizoctonia solani 123E]